MPPPGAPVRGRRHGERPVRHVSSAWRRDSESGGKHRARPATLSSHAPEAVASRM
jgi:hypothetical protein